MMNPNDMSDQEPMEAQAPEGGDEPITAAGMRSQMKFPKGMEKAYDKVITAGLKLMFDPTMREDTMQFMEESGGDPQKMAEGVSAVVLMLFQESNETIPPNLLIPAGMELLVHAAEVAKAGGAEVSNGQLAEGMGNMVEQILVKFGATPEQMQKLMSGMDSGQAAPETGIPPGQPGIPQSEGGGLTSAPAASGLVSGAMALGA